MAITDQELLSDIQSLVAEPLDGGASFPSGMWTPSEVLHYLDENQQDIVESTALVLRRITIACTPHVLYQELPQGWIATQRLVWVRVSDNRHFVLHRSDIWELDAALGASWRQQSGIPGYYTDADVPTLTVQIAPAPSVPGTLKLTYLAVPTLFTGAGAAAEIPDEPTVGLVWGTISHMLTKDSRAKDPARAALAQQRMRMANEAVRLILQGWEA